jgi:hypothetical protein
VRVRPARQGLPAPPPVARRCRLVPPGLLPDLQVLPAVRVRQAVPHLLRAALRPRQAATGRRPVPVLLRQVPLALRPVASPAVRHHLRHRVPAPILVRLLLLVRARAPLPVPTAKGWFSTIAASATR